MAQMPWATESAPALTPEEAQSLAAAITDPDPDTGKPEPTDENAAPTVVNKPQAVKISDLDNSSEEKVYDKGSSRVVVGGEQASLALINLVSAGMTVSQAKAKLRGEEIPEVEERKDT